MSYRHFQRMSPEREQRVLENLQAWGERGSPQIRAIAVRKTEELLPGVIGVRVGWAELSPHQFSVLLRQLGFQSFEEAEAAVN